LTLITLCHGSLSLSDDECSSQTTCRAPLGLPAKAAIWP
jgi:hypothetical protein